MLSRRNVILICLIILAALSAWLLNRLTETESKLSISVIGAPDYYLENFKTTVMREDGTPRNTLHAIYMSHYPDNDTSELLKPTMEIYRKGNRPYVVSADKGWITSDNEVILLKGSVQMTEYDDSGNRTLQVNTDSARVLPGQNYAETDDYAKIVSHRVTITGNGMRAYFNDGRLEVLNNVHTTIEPH
jgi:lipopolysaccharide export system protein LptC